MTPPAVTRWRCFLNHHPVYNDYFIPFWDFIKTDDPKSKFISPMVLDWPRYWRISPDFKDFSFVEHSTGHWKIF